MAKTPETNRQTITLELYVVGKRKKPSISAVFGEDGLHLDALDSPEYKALDLAARNLAKLLFEMGELKYPKGALDPR